MTYGLSYIKASKEDATVTINDKSVIEVARKHHVSRLTLCHTSKYLSEYYHDTVSVSRYCQNTVLWG